MNALIELIRLKHPEMADLLQPVMNGSDLLQEFEKMQLPDDYYQTYRVVNGEKEESDGVFGLHKLLPLEVALKHIVKDPEELANFKGKFTYELFVPIFQIPGRVLIGYAKKDDGWDFAEYDLGVSPSRYATSLTDFFQQFKAKLLNDGYATESGFKGLIDRDEM